MVSWFRSKRKAATDAATQSLRPLIAMAQMRGGMSFFMWRDPYLLGYMNATATFSAKCGTNEKASPEEIGFAVVDAFSNVSNMNGFEIAKKVLSLGLSQDSEYKKGTDDAISTALYALGMLNEEDNHPLVIRSIPMVVSSAGMLPDYDERSAVAGAMIQASFVERIDELRSADLA